LLAWSILQSVPFCAVDYRICEAALAHVIENKAEAAYRRSDLFDKRRKLMEAWAVYCEAPKADKLVAFIRLTKARREKKNQRTTASTKLASRAPRHCRAHRSNAASAMPALPRASPHFFFKQSHAWILGIS
jgi:hypothetical protein